ncbi:MAG: hypothetical protein RIR00_2399, partial [Pseudomonadota bacterium]
DRANTERVPFLGDLPLIGALFRYQEKQHNKHEMLVFITPRVISESLTLK